MARILVTGIATRDIVNIVDHYPGEDEELRALEQEIRPGGNAANTSMLLAQHGHDVEFLGTIAKDTTGNSLLESLQANGLRTDHCPRMSGASPTSYITLNCCNGSRTIIHYRDLPELSAVDFPVHTASDYDWIHFEGRNIAETRDILISLQAKESIPVVSLEVEKPRDDITSLFDYVDVLFFSRVYANAMNFDDPEAFLYAMQDQLDKKHLLICSWGEAGAAGIDSNGEMHIQAAWQPADVIDTIGAGDTFNAGIIHAFYTGKTLQAALGYACELAGRKVGQHGLDGIVDNFST